MTRYNLTELKYRAKELRRKTLDLGMEHQEYHFGGAFSSIEILLSLYDVILKDDDKFILSKGHSCLPYYLLLREKGFNPKISGHPDIDIKNGIYCSTGSLGHGLPIGTGMALARKLKGKPGNIYVLMSDGELQEGSIWETIPVASRRKLILDNLTMIVDYNKIQALDRLEDVTPFGDLAVIFKTFNLYVSEVDGHSFPELISVLEKKVYDQPKMIIAHTTKGKGASPLEDDPKWHARKPENEELRIIYEELK